MRTTLLRLVAPALLLTALAACQFGGGLRPAPGSTGEPPLIPHYVAGEDGGETCLACHREGEGGAPVTPHPHLVDCRQCHIDQQQGVAPFAPSY